jgi:hypothetical protein
MPTLDSLTYAVLRNGHVVVERQSSISGIVNSMCLPITADDVIAFAKDGGKTLIQDLLPQLNAEQREFLKTGITPEEWNNIFKES